MRLVLPKLYVILDAALLSSSETEIAMKLADAGVRLLQYRNKNASSGELLGRSRELASALRSRGVTFIVNDRADVAALSGSDGVHLGQEDLSVEAARNLVGEKSLVGVSTHSLPQFREALTSSADYLAVGPIYPTGSKANPDPVVGIEMLRRVRGLTELPIVAIGGITLQRAPEVIQAGADAVAVISDILRAPSPADRARNYLEVLADESRDRASAAAKGGVGRNFRNGSESRG
jgi:thiamine-phosphate pyrophosphorylase